MHALMLIGLLLVTTLLASVALKRSTVPPLIAYMLLGTGLGWLDSVYGVIDAASATGIGLLGEAGLVMLLFKVGLESDLKKLLRQLPRATWVWFWNVTVSGALGFCAAYYIVHFSIISSLFVAVALTATSVGVTVMIWDQAGLLKTRKGDLLLDVAELDDLSSILLMAVITALAPVLQMGNGFEWIQLGSVLGTVLVTLLIFIAACSLFSVLFEERLTRLVETKRRSHQPMLMIIGIGFMIAALSEKAGLSLAVGAFFAGLAFSRDTEATKEKVVFESLYEFLTPFFFISLGTLIDISAFQGALWPGIVLLAAAIVGKLAGAGLPIIGKLGVSSALLVGLSMVPRAEIALVVIERGLSVGTTQEAFAAIMIVSAGTVTLTALILPRLIRRTR